MRFYRWLGGGGRGVTFGYSQAYEAAAKEGRFPFASQRTANSLPLVRRLTGGGVVSHDGDITLSLVFPWERLVSPSWIYKDIHRSVHLGLKAREIASRLWSDRSVFSPTRGPVQCFPKPVTMDLVHESGEKFMGGALRRRKGIGLYQASLRPEGFAVSEDVLKAAVTEGFSTYWKVEFKPKPVNPEVLVAAERLGRDRYGSDNWNKKR